MDGEALMFHATYKDVVAEVSRRIRDWQTEHPWATYLQLDAALDELVQLARAQEREEQQPVVVQPIASVDNDFRARSSARNRAGR